MFKRWFMTLCGVAILCTAQAAAPTTAVDLIRVNPPEVFVRMPTSVVFSARVASDDLHKPASVHLLRLQWSGNEREVAKMFDNGTHGDATAKDGIYTCTLKLKESIIGLLGFRIQVMYKGQSLKVFSQGIFVKVIGD